MITGAIITAYLNRALALFSLLYGNRVDNLKAAFRIHCALAIFIGMDKQYIEKLINRFEQAQLRDKEIIYDELWFTLLSQIRVNLDEIREKARGTEVFHTIESEPEADDILNQI